MIPQIQNLTLLHNETTYKLTEYYGMLCRKTVNCCENNAREKRIKTHDRRNLGKPVQRLLLSQVGNTLMEKQTEAIQIFDAKMPIAKDYWEAFPKKYFTYHSFSGSPLAGVGQF